MKNQNMMGMGRKKLEVAAEGEAGDAQFAAGQNRDNGPKRKAKKAKKGKMKGHKKGKMKGRMHGHRKGHKHDLKGEEQALHRRRRNKEVNKNPVKYIRSVGHNIVTSLADQTTTTLTVATTPQNTSNEDFLVVIAFMCYKGANSGTTTCTDSLGNTYTKLSEVAYNSGYVVTLFAASGVNSLAKNCIVTVTHPGSQRRIIMGDEFKNIEKTNAADKTAAAYNSVPATFATSGMTATTSQGKELLYGVIGVNGPSTDSFKRAQSWTILHDRGTNAGDSQDIRLITLFRLTGQEATYEVSGTLGTARLWGSITQSFRAEGGASDVSKD